MATNQSRVVIIFPVHQPWMATVEDKGCWEEPSGNDLLICETPTASLVTNTTSELALINSITQLAVKHQRLLWQPTCLSLWECVGMRHWSHGSFSSCKTESETEGLTWKGSGITLGTSVEWFNLDTLFMVCIIRSHTRAVRHKSIVWCKRNRKVMVNSVFTVLLRVKG